MVPTRTALCGGALLAALVLPLRAQGIDDGFMTPKKALSLGALYTHERWSEYWEGGLKRSNENLGTLTTETVTFAAHYGLTDRLDIIAMVPYVRTRASQGPLHGMQGVQDVTIAAKYRLLTAAMPEVGTLSAIAVAAAGIPASDYTPDFLPMSIGLASRCFSGRFTLHFQSKGPWFINGSAAHSWRSKVTLDRSAYFTDGQLFLTNEVAMPRVADGTLSAGYKSGRLLIPISLSRHHTLGGGDIRRQDMPFVSNRMDFTKLDAFAMYALNIPRVPAIRFGATRTLTGRNVGQATTITAGAFYNFTF